MSLVSDKHRKDLNQRNQKQFISFFRGLARKYQTGILEYWDFMNIYADLSTSDGLGLLEIHLSAKLRELEEEESRKILDLERDLAELNIESNESFRAAGKNNGLDLEQVLADLQIESKSENDRGDGKVKDFGLLDLKNGNNFVSL